MRTMMAVLAVGLAGCAAMQNTRAQDLVWDAYHQCQAEQRVAGNLQVIRVEPDGRAWYSGYSSVYGLAELENCITEKVTAAATAPATATPAPASTATPVVGCPGNTFWNGVGCTSR